MCVRERRFRNRPRPRFEALPRLRVEAVGTMEGSRFYPDPVYTRIL